ncbi:MAG: hypothetical protein ACPKQO_01160 [Nitrososphaeraceae archaeon]
MGDHYLLPIQQKKNSKLQIILYFQIQILKQKSSHLDYIFLQSIAFLGPSDFVILEKNTGLVKRVIDGNVVSKPHIN